MGAGSSALIWYGLCTAFVAFVVIISSGLILYGQRAEARQRKARERLPEPPAPSAETSTVDRDS